MIEISIRYFTKDDNANYFLEPKIHDALSNGATKGFCQARIRDTLSGCDKIVEFASESEMSKEQVMETVLDLEAKR